MAIQNNQWQYRGLTVSGSYQRIVSIRWEADSTKTYYDDEAEARGTVREEANCNVRVGTYANYNERTGSRRAFVEHNDYHLTVDLTSSLISFEVGPRSKSFSFKVFFLKLAPR